MPVSRLWITVLEFLSRIWEESLKGFTALIRLVPGKWEAQTGLSIAREIEGLHGGHIEAKSEPNKTPR